MFSESWFLPKEVACLRLCQDMRTLQSDLAELAEQGTRHVLNTSSLRRLQEADKHWGSDAMCCMADVADYNLLGDQSVKHRWEGIPYLLRNSLARGQELLAFARA